MLSTAQPFVYTASFISQQPHEIGSLTLALEVMKLGLREAE